MIASMYRRFGRDLPFSQSHTVEQHTPIRCPCGYLGDAKRECRCSPSQIQRYRARISGPLLDRIDIHIEAPALGIGELRREDLGERSTAIRTRVEEAREQQRDRLQSTDTRCNANMTLREIRTHCHVTEALGDLLQQAMEQLPLSARAYDRILKVARTIADLAGSEMIDQPHLLGAIQYRSLDRAVFY
jgi:magnesium chelatase family protein